MTNKLLLTFGILMYTLGVPLFEIMNTHDFYPDWTPYARIHEVWQLITNSSIGLFCLWLVWRKKQIVIPSILSLFLTGGFLLAYFLQDFYVDSMRYVYNPEKTLFGDYVALFSIGIVFLIFLFTVFLKALEYVPERKKTNLKHKWIK